MPSARRRLLRAFVCSWRGHREGTFTHHAESLAQTLVYCARCYLPLRRKDMTCRYPLPR